jgi:glycosyltransferase involved in cell wall biosynthesis
MIYGNLSRLVGELDKLNVHYEVIVVSDGNTDATVREAQRLGSPAVHVFHYPMNIGKGFALSFGVSQSKGSLVTFVDADMKLDPANISAFMELMRTTNCDAVVGSKRHPMSRVSYPFLRTLQSAVYQQLIHLLFNLNIRDAQAGLKLFRRNVLEDVLPLLTVKKFAFDLELLVVAQQLGYRSIVEAPIRLTAHFKRTVDPRTVLGILRDTIAIYYRLRISGYYARQRRRNQGPEDSETPPSELLGKRPSLRILILNWRCPRNPRGGGAEAVTFEVARRLVRQGDTVEWFAGSFPGAPSEEMLDGVRIVRSGRPWTVHWRAFRRYHAKLAEDFDMVVDEVNAIPFFTPLWAKKVPVVIFIHQLIREIWWYEARFPLSVIGFLTEPLYLRCYRNVPVLTGSESTREDLRRLGFRGSITMIPYGRESITDLLVTKPEEPHFLYVGRLVPSKRVEDVINAFAIFCESGEPAELCLLGSGAVPYVEELRNLVDRLGLAKLVRFVGHVSIETKHQEMAAAHMLLMTSAREGWGLVVTEANAFGTPAVAYDVPGLRDSIHHHETGLLVPPSPRLLAEAMSRLWQDRALYKQLSDGAVAWSDAFSFDQTTRAFRAGLASMISKRSRLENDALATDREVGSKYRSRV